MERIKSQKKSLPTKWFLIICLSFFPTVSFSQVLNGSFEIDGQPSLDNWIIDHGESYQDAPGDGGSWCLKLESGNVQGGFPYIAYQIIPEFKNGEIWQVSARAKRDSSRSPLIPPSIYLKIFHITGDETNLSADTTFSKEWTQLTFIDTLFLEESDCVAIVLEAGLIGGPLTSWSYFDLVAAEKIGEVGVDNFNQLHPKDFKLFQNFPNPFNPRTTFSYQMPKSAMVKLSIQNITGQTVKTLVNEHQNAGFHSVQWDVPQSGISSGLYFYRLNAGEYSATKNCLILR